jgi:hypothetical protein
MPNNSPANGLKIIDGFFVEDKRCIPHGGEIEIWHCQLINSSDFRGPLGVSFKLVGMKHLCTYEVQGEAHAQDGCEFAGFVGFLAGAKGLRVWLHKVFCERTEKGPDQEEAVNEAVSELMKEVGCRMAMLRSKVKVKNADLN